jgi:hypothetical protein
LLSELEEEALLLVLLLKVDELLVRPPVGGNIIVVPSTSKDPLDPNDIVCDPIVCSTGPGVIVVLPKNNIVLPPVATSPEAKVTVS